MPFSNPTTKDLAGLALALLLVAAGGGVQCRPHMLLIYQINPDQLEPWKRMIESEDTLRATYMDQGLEVRLLVAGRDFLPRHSLRMMQNREAGELDEQIIRIIAANAGKTRREFDFRKLVIESSAGTIRQLDAAQYNRQVYAPGRLDYGFYFGQRHIGQFGLPAPDYLLHTEADTASPWEKEERLRAKLKQSPWVSPAILPGEIHAGYLVFPRLETETDLVLRLDQPDASVIPPLKFRIHMMRRLSSEDEPEIAEESRRSIMEEEAWIRRMNEDFFVMHAQLRRHEEISRKKAD